MKRTVIPNWWQGLGVQQKVWTILLVVFVPVVLAFALHVSLIKTLLALRHSSFTWCCP